jgi:hypothetical protein
MCFSKYVELPPGPLLLILAKSFTEQLQGLAKCLYDRCPLVIIIKPTQLVTID